MHHAQLKTCVRAHKSQREHMRVEDKREGEFRIPIESNLNLSEFKLFEFAREYQNKLTRARAQNANRLQ